MHDQKREHVQSNSMGRGEPPHVAQPPQLIDGQIPSSASSPIFSADTVSTFADRTVTPVSSIAFSHPDGEEVGMNATMTTASDFFATDFSIQLGHGVERELRELWTTLWVATHTEEGLQRALAGPQTAWNPYRHARGGPELQKEVLNSEVVEFQHLVPINSIYVQGSAIRRPHSHASESVKRTSGNWVVATPPRNRSTFSSIDDGCHGMQRGEERLSIQLHDLGGGASHLRYSGAPLSPSWRHGPAPKEDDGEVFIAHGSGSRKQTDGLTGPLHLDTSQDGVPLVVQRLPVALLRNGREEMAKVLFQRLWAEVVIPFYETKLYRNSAEFIPLAAAQAPYAEGSMQADVLNSTDVLGATIDDVVPCRSRDWNSVDLAGGPSMESLRGIVREMGLQAIPKAPRCSSTTPKTSSTPIAHRESATRTGRAPGSFTASATSPSTRSIEVEELAEPQPSASPAPNRSLQAWRLSLRPSTAHVQGSLSLLPVEDSPLPVADQPAVFEPVIKAKRQTRGSSTLSASDDAEPSLASSNRPKGQNSDESTTRIIDLERTPSQSPGRHGSTPVKKAKSRGSVSARPHRSKMTASPLFNAFTLASAVYTNGAVKVRRPSRGPGTNRTSSGLLGNQRSRSSSYHSPTETPGRGTWAQSAPGDSATRDTRKRQALGDVSVTSMSPKGRRALSPVDAEAPPPLSSSEQRQRNGTLSSVDTVGSRQHGRLAPMPLRPQRDSSTSRVLRETASAVSPKRRLEPLAGGPLPCVDQGSSSLPREGELGSAARDGEMLPAQEGGRRRRKKGSLPPS